MARPLLIALLTVAAVAWPAAGQDLPVPDLAEPSETVEDPGLVVTTAYCRPFQISTGPNAPLPDTDVRLDPDGCIRRFIDDIWPLGPLDWLDPTYDGFLLQI